MKNFLIRENELLLGTEVSVPSSIATFESTTKGFLIPRMTATQRDAISSPATGLLIYNLSTNQLDVFSGSSWGAVAPGSFTNTYALAFNMAGSSNQYVDLGFTHAYERTNSFSLSLRTSFPERTGTVTLLSKRNVAPSLRGYNIDLLTTGAIRVALTSDASSNNLIQVTTTTLFSRNTPYHIVVTYDGSSTAAGLKIYVDGNLEAVTVDFNALSGTILNAVSAKIGAYGTALQTFQGIIDEVSYWGDDLTAGEVTELYNFGRAFDLFTHSAVGDLQSWYRMGDQNDTTDMMFDYVGTDHGSPQNMSYLNIVSNVPETAFDRIVVGRGTWINDGTTAPGLVFANAGNTGFLYAFSSLGIIVNNFPRVVIGSASTSIYSGNFSINTGGELQTKLWRLNVMNTRAIRMDFSQDGNDRGGLGVDNSSWSATGDITEWYVRLSNGWNGVPYETGVNAWDVMRILLPASSGTITIKPQDNAVASINRGLNYRIQAGAKTAGTGPGGILQLAGGSSSGGLEGYVETLNKLVLPRVNGANGFVSPVDQRRFLEIEGTNTGFFWDLADVFYMGFSYENTVKWYTGPAGFNIYTGNLSFDGTGHIVMNGSSPSNGRVQGASKFATALQVTGKYLSLDLGGDPGAGYAGLGQERTYSSGPPYSVYNFFWRYWSDADVYDGVNPWEINQQWFGATGTWKIYPQDNAVVSANSGVNVDIFGGNKTAGTGRGGDVALGGGTSSGGIAGSVNIENSRFRLTSTTAAGTTTISNSTTYHGVTGIAGGTVTLPLAASVLDGTILYIKDEGGNASTNNITVTRAGAELIDGATSVLISVDYGVLRLIARNSNWWVL